MSFKKPLAAAFFCIILQTASVYTANEPPLEKMAGRMIMTGFRGYEIPQKLKDQIKDIKIGGVLILGHNVKDLRQVVKITADIREAAGNRPFFIAIDQEGGKVARLKASNGFEDFPSAKQVAGAKSLEEAFVLYSRMAAMLKYCGINLNLAPVLDLDIDPASPTIGKLERSFSADPSTTERYAVQFIRAHNEYGILTCAKHFPGHGSAGSDSHLGITDITKAWKETELKPYEDLIKQDELKMVMTGRINGHRIDESFTRISELEQNL